MFLTSLKPSQLVCCKKNAYVFFGVHKHLHSSEENFENPTISEKIFYLFNGQLVRLPRPLEEEWQGFVPPSRDRALVWLQSWDGKVMAHFVFEKKTDLVKSGSLWILWFAVRAGLQINCAFSYLHVSPMGFH